MQSELRQYSKHTETTWRSVCEKSESRTSAQVKRHQRLKGLTEKSESRSSAQVKRHQRLKALSEKSESRTSAQVKQHQRLKYSNTKLVIAKNPTVKTI